MPNTLAHFGAQGLISHGLVRRVDPRLVLLGCLLPDLPWILRRAVVGLGIPADVFELRLYTMGLASLAATLLLAAAVAALTQAARGAFAVLSANALLHLLLDATEVKFGNGVHLAAPVSWTMTSFDLVPGESPVYLALTLAGVAVAAWALARPDRMTVRLVPRPGRIAAAAALALAYLLAPLPFLGAIEASGSYSVKVVRERDERPGRPISLDRTGFTATPAGGFVALWTGERVRATGELPAADAIVSLHGVFLTPDVLRVDRMMVHRGGRDWPSYAGLVLLLAVLARRPRPARPAPASTERRRSEN